MRGGMGSLTEGDVRLRCPLFLFSEETAGELETLLRDLRGGGYTPLSLRELFRCRRGLRPWPPRPCAILLRGVPFAMLRGILPLLERWETPVSLFCLAPYGEDEIEELRSSRWLRFYGDADADEGIDLLPEGGEQHIAAFCETPDERAVGFLREKRIWMAVTCSLPVGSVSGGNIPKGMDLLYALPVRRGNRLPELLARWHRALTAQETPKEIPQVGLRFEEPQAQTASVFLPLETHPPVTDPTAAVYLSILGNTPERMEQVLLTIDWNPVFDPSDGSYRLRPFRRALAEEPLALSTEAFLLALGQGSYPFLRPRVLSPEGVLLFGYDGEREVFTGMAARSGGYERADFRPHTLMSGCETCGVTRLTPDPSALSFSETEAKAWAEAAMEDSSAAEGVRQGWDASVAFANRVSGGGAVSAASLRAFLEERMLCALRLKGLYERERLYAEPAERYLALLEKEVRPVLRDLQGREDVPAEHGNLLQRLLNAEGLCRRGFSEEAERMRALRAFQAEKNAKRNKMF